MKKLCARCGVIYEAVPNQKFCSGKCEQIFQQSSLGYLKKETSQRKVFAP